MIEFNKGIQMKDRLSKIGSINQGSAMQRDEAQAVTAKAKKTLFNNLLNAQFNQISGKPLEFKKTLFDPNVQLLPNFTIREGGFKGAYSMVMKHEGTGYVKNDAMRGPAKMGILQSTAREFGYTGDIKNLTPAQAEFIYQKLWDRSGAASLPYPLSAVHFDTYVNSPSASKRILQKSGGDVNAYLAMREQRYIKLAQLRPERFGGYLDGWMNRIASLKDMAVQYAKVNTANAKVASTGKVNTRG